MDDQQILKSQQALEQLQKIQEQLKDLRDIHVPDPVSFWPIAPGWWALLVLIPALYFIIRFIVKRLLMPKYKKMALKELENIITNYNVAHDAHETCGEVALLIRQALVAKIGNQKIAGLVTEEWLSYLDKLSKTESFTQGAGRHIVTTAYANPNSKDSDNESNSIDVDELFNATKKLLRNL